MYRRLLLLNGLAILGVVVSHAAGWGQIALLDLNWTNRYLPATVTGEAHIGSFTYYVLLIVRQLLVFSVPAFLVVSGFFIAFAARGSQVGLSWKVVRARLYSLLIPYLIWSVLIFIGDALTHQVYTPGEYVMRLLLWGATGPLYYVPMLCEF